MLRCLLLLFLSISLVGLAPAQQDSPAQRKTSSPNQPPRSDRDAEAGESSSRDTRIDISPPKDDAKNHPSSTVPDELDDANSSDVSEFHPWDPHKALKDIEVGDYYFKRKNYHAALDRYKEALFYKDNDALATFRIAQCDEKLGNAEEALKNYEAYLKILPHGPLAEDAQKSIARLKMKDGDTSPTAKK